MSFEKPTLILGSDQVFLVLFSISAMLLIFAAKKINKNFGIGEIYILFFVLLIPYILIRRVYG